MTTIPFDAHQGQLFIGTYDFIVEIKSGEFQEIVQNVRRIIRERKIYQTSSTPPSKNILKDYVLRSINEVNERRSIKAHVILSSFKEIKGSYLLQFTYLIFNTLANYGQVRESLDYVRDDLKELFGQASPDTTIFAGWNPVVQTRFGEDPAFVQPPKPKRSNTIIIAIALSLCVAFTGYQIVTDLLKDNPQEEDINSNKESFEHLLKTESRLTATEKDIQYLRDEIKSLEIEIDQLKVELKKNDKKH